MAFVPIRRAWPLAAVLAALLLLNAFSAGRAQAADPTPVLVFQYPEEGSTFNQTVFAFHLCFADKINIRDLPAGGDFRFTLTEPDGLGLGHRDVFQPDALGVAIYPGNPIGDTAGPWKLTWRVTSPDGQSPLEGEINWTIDPSGEDTPQSTPPPCIGEEGTGTVPPSATPTVAPTTVAASGSVKPSASAGPTASPVDEGKDDPDIDKYAFITIGIAGAAAVIVTIGYFIRKRVGYDPHKPGPGDDSGHH
jgi:methionine-rich copper-binding protein CopC